MVVWLCFDDIFELIWHFKSIFNKALKDGIIANYCFLW